MIEYTVKVFKDGSKSWFLGSKRHREDGPAIEGADGTKHWLLHGRLHRDDGPAIEYVNGDKHWFLNGKEVTEQEVVMKSSCSGKIVNIDGKKYRLEEI